MQSISSEIAVILIICNLLSLLFGAFHNWNFFLYSPFFKIFYMCIIYYCIENYFIKLTVSTSKIGSSGVGGERKSGNGNKSEQSPMHGILRKKNIRFWIDYCYYSLFFLCSLLIFCLILATFISILIIINVVIFIFLPWLFLFNIMNIFW